MSEDAFERFRRLRGVAQLVSVQEQAQQREGEAPLSPLVLLQQLHELGVVLTPTCDYGDVPPEETPASPRPLVFGLHVDALQGVLTDALRLAIRTQKAELVDVVEEWSERAALAEYCGGLPRADAEALAWEWLVEQEAREVSTPA